MNLSVCIITKNDEHNLSLCLEKLSSYGFEIVIVDTGSSDQTKEMAAHYTDKIYDFEWCNDFAAAKNYAIQMALNEFVMVIDSDEYIQDFNVNHLFQKISQNKHLVGRIKRINTFDKNKGQEENQEWINRIFSKNLYHYKGSIHEQVVRKNGEAYDTYLSNVEIKHSGYDLTAEEKKRKTDRNITLLKAELESLGEDPYLLYQLGKGYYMAGDYEQACLYFSKGLSFDLNPKLEYVIDMVEAYGYGLLNDKRYQEALFFEQIYDEFGATADFQFLMGLIYMNNALFEKAVLEFEKAVKQKICKVKGVNSYTALYNIGVIYECLGDKEKAVTYYNRCGEYKPANERLKNI